MTIYDAHMHIGGLSDPEPAKLLEKLNKCGITGGNVLSIDPDDPRFDYKYRIDNLFQWVKGCEDRLFPVAWLHPYEENILDKVRDCAARGVKAFKFIPNNYHVYDEIPTKVFKLIEELGLPIMFHSGTLYDFLPSSQYNMPNDWECFIGYDNLRFSMAHCANPWVTECLILYGKYRWIAQHADSVAKGKPDIYVEFPWIKSHVYTDENGNRTYKSPQLFIDTTPGTHGVYRREMLRNYCSSYPDGMNMFFGTDKYVEEYPVDIVTTWLAEEKEALESVNATEEFYDNMYWKNMFKFLGIERKV